jgi:hypothetical protein
MDERHPGQGPSYPHPRPPLHPATVAGHHHELRPGVRAGGRGCHGAPRHGASLGHRDPRVREDPQAPRRSPARADRAVTRPVRGDGSVPAPPVRDPAGAHDDRARARGRHLDGSRWFTPPGSAPGTGRRPLNPVPPAGPSSSPPRSLPEHA